MKANPWIRKSGAAAWKAEAKEAARTPGSCSRIPEFVRQMGIYLYPAVRLNSDIIVNSIKRSIKPSQE